MNPTKTYRITTWLLWLMTLVCSNLYAGSLRVAGTVVEQEQTFVLAEDIFSATVDRTDQRSTISQELSLSHSQKSAYAGEGIAYTLLRADNITKAGGKIDNLVNKIDNVIDDVSEQSLKEASIIDELAKTNNSISDAAKKFWANHETNVTKYLRETHGVANVGRQITVDITLKSGEKITCRLDNLVRNGNSYKIIDAKSSVTKSLHQNSADEIIKNFATKNQKTFYDALKNGNVQSIKPRGDLAEQFFKGPPPSNLNIDNSVEFLVNDVATSGYSIYRKTFNF